MTGFFGQEVKWTESKNPGLSANAGIGSSSGATLGNIGGAATRNPFASSPSAASPTVVVNLPPSTNWGSAPPTLWKSDTGQTPTRSSSSGGSAPVPAGFYYPDTLHNANAKLTLDRAKQINADTDKQRQTTLIALVAVAGIVVWKFFL